MLIIVFSQPKGQEIMTAFTTEKRNVRIEMIKGLIGNDIFIPLIMIGDENEVSFFDQNDAAEIKNVQIQLDQGEDQTTTTISLYRDKIDVDPPWQYILKCPTSQIQEFLRLFHSEQVWTLLIRCRDDIALIVNKEDGSVEDKYYYEPGCITEATCN